MHDWRSVYWNANYMLWQVDFYVFIACLPKLQVLDNQAEARVWVEAQRL